MVGMRWRMLAFAARGRWVRAIRCCVSSDATVHGYKSFPILSILSARYFLSTLGLITITGIANSAEPETWYYAGSPTGGNGNPPEN